MGVAHQASGHDLGRPFPFGPQLSLCLREEEVGRPFQRVWLCQVLSSSPHWALSLCVEASGEVIRAGGKWGTGIALLWMPGTPRDTHRLGGPGQPLPTGGGGGWLSRGWHRRQPGCSPGPVEMPGGWEDDVLSGAPSYVSIKYTPRRHPSSVRTAAPVAACPLLFFPLRRPRLRWLGRVACPGPHPPGSRCHSSQSESPAQGVGSLSGSSSSGGCPSICLSIRSGQQRRAG